MVNKQFMTGRFNAVILGLSLIASFILISDHKAYANQCPGMSQECLEDLMMRESSGDWGIVSQDGYLGAYQFGEMALQDVGFYAGDNTNRSCARSAGGCDWVGEFTGFMGINSVDDYLNSQEAQMYAVNQLAMNNMDRFYDDLAPYIGTTINGIEITCEGLMIGMHLRGYGTDANPGVGDFVQSGGATDNTDANGTPVSEYIGMGAECTGGVTMTQTEFESCDENILSTGTQLGESRMEIEKQQIDEAISKPQSVVELSCFDQIGEMFSQEVAGIFGNTDGDLISGLGLDIFGFDQIFGDVQQNINDQISGAINNGLLGGRGETIGESVSTLVSDALGGVMGGGGGNVGFSCEAMNLLWEIMQCEDIFDFKIPSLQDLIGDFNLRDEIMGLMPDSCAGQILTDYAIENGAQIFSSFSASAPSSTSPETLNTQINSY